VRLDFETLERLYGMTAAECRVAAAVCAGETLCAVGERLGVSENTVKTQLQNVYQKTGTHRQAQLVKVLLSLSSSATGG
jgi:DNA-binding CsgD family transcriptional regulator